MADNQQTFETQMTADVSDLVKGMNTVKTSLGEVEKAANAIVDSFKKIEQFDFSKLGKNITHLQSIASPTVSSRSGTIISPSGSKNKNFAAAQQAVAVDMQKQVDMTNQLIKKEKELTKLAKERAKVVAQESASRAKEADARQKRVDFINSTENKDYLKAKSDYYKLRTSRPELFAAGALNHNWRYQSSRVMSEVGQRARGLPVGGQLLGGVLEAGAGFLKSPQAGVTTIFKELGNSLIDLSKDATKAFAEIESIKTQLEVVFSSKTQSDVMFRDISKYAVKSPFGIQETSELAILLKQSGVYASDLMDTLKMLGDTAGGNMERMKRIANNYAQITSIGKASMLDMRQFAYAGIPIFEAVSEELGVSQSRLRELISDGKVTSDIIEKVFKNLTGVNGIFQDSTEKGVKTLKARLQNLSDSKQLAMASIGEFGANIGRQTGNDSLLNKLVTNVENIYSWLHSSVNTVNIQGDVKTIARRDSRISQLESLIEYNETVGNKEYVKVLKEQLKKERSKASIDSDRATYTNSYESKQNKFSILNEYGLRIEETDSIRKLYEDINKQVLEIGAKSSEAAIQRDRIHTNLYSGIYSGNSYRNVIFTEQDLQKAILTADGLAGEYDVLRGKQESLRRVLQLSLSIKDEEIQAYKETNLLKAQQLAFDNTKKTASTPGSMYSNAQELASIFENNDEQKKKREEEHIKVLKATQEELKKLNSKADERGIIDFTKLSMADFIKASGDGIITANRKLDVVPTDATREQKEIQRIELLDNFGHAVSEVTNSLEELGKPGTAKELKKNFDTLKSLKTDKFFKQFKNFYFDKFSKNINELIKSDPTNKDIYEKQRKMLLGSMIEYQGEFRGKDIDIDTKLKDSSKIFIPLWKRIISSYTGINTEGFKSVNEAMKLYKEEVLPRQTAKSIFADILKEGGSVDDIQKFLKPNGNKVVLRGTNSGTNQLGWKQANEQLKNFALQLRTTTSYVKSYKSVLEAEYETYINLMSEGITSGETQDIKTAKNVSAEKFGELSKDAAAQFVNAFGDQLENTDGKVVSYIQNGIAYDDKGIALANQEIVITEHLFEFIKQEIPKLRKEIATANKTELQNSILGNIAGKVKDLSYSNAISLAGLDRPDLAGIISDNSKELTEYADNILKEILRKKLNLADTEKISNEDVNNAISGKTLSEEDISKAIKQALNGVSVSGSYKGLSAVYSAQEALQKDLTFFDTLFGVNPEPKTKSKSKSKKKSKKRDDSSSSFSFEDIKSGSDLLEYLFGENAFKLANIPFQATSSLDYDTVNRERREIRAEAFKQRNTFSPDEEIDTSKLNELGVNQEILDMLNNQNTTYKERIDLLNQIAEANKDITDETVRHKIAQDSIDKSLKNMGSEMVSIGIQATSQAFTGTFEALGASLATGADAADLMGDNLRESGKEMLKNVSSTMVNTGLQIAGASALDQNWAGVAGGLALAAAGGLAGGFFNSLLSDSSDSDEDDDKTSKLESLADKIADLLEQARIDADYYEKNLRHKTALGINAGYSNKITTNVNDAVITPQGKVISTAPDDYLIATKTPETLGSTGQVNVQPKVNIIVNKNTAANVDVNVEQRIEPDGTVQVVAIIEDIVGQYIGSRRSDDAFAARNALLQGVQGIM